MRRMTITTVLGLGCVFSSSAIAQQLSTPTTGPIIDGFGAVYAVPEADWEMPPEHVFKVVFEVAESSETPDQLNRRIATLARFLNMHAQAGVPMQNMQLALVVHGGAGKDVLHNEAYEKRFGLANPNLPLIAALAEHDVQIILCGQTAAYRGLPKEDLAPQVHLALSAMTALVLLQSEGYELIVF